METVKCPSCKNRNAGFDCSTGEVICEECGTLLPPNYEKVTNSMNGANPAIRLSQEERELVLSALATTACEFEKFLKEVSLPKDAREWWEAQVAKYKALRRKIEDDQVVQPGDQFIHAATGKNGFVFGSVYTVAKISNGSAACQINHLMLEPPRTEGELVHYSASAFNSAMRTGKAF